MGEFVHRSEAVKAQLAVDAFDRGLLAARYGEKVAGYPVLPTSEVLFREIAVRVTDPSEISCVDTHPGDYRNCGVVIRSSNVSYPNAAFVPVFMREFGASLDKKVLTLDAGQERTVPDVLDVIAFAMYWLVRIHPYANGNGRTAREYANVICRRYGLKPIFVGPVDKLDYVKCQLNVNVSARFPYYEEANLDPLTLFLTRRLRRSYNEKNPGDIEALSQIDILEAEIIQRQDEKAGIGTISTPQTTLDVHGL